MPLNANRAQAVEHHARVFIDKTPLTAGIGRMFSPVPTVTPSIGPVGMSFANPASEFPEDVVSQLVENFRADDSSLVVGPASKDGVEHFNQTAGIAALQPLKRLLEFLTKRRHTFLSGFNQQFPSRTSRPAPVMADVESQKIEAF